MPRPKSDHPTPGELEALKILWEHGPSTVRQVMERLNEDRPRAYTSVMSLLGVMADKGLLNRKPQGRAFVYEPAVREGSTPIAPTGRRRRDACGLNVSYVVMTWLSRRCAAGRIMWRP